MMELGQFLFGGVLIVFGCHALIPCVFIILSTGQAGTKQGPMEGNSNGVVGVRRSS